MYFIMPTAPTCGYRGPSKCGWLRLEITVRTIPQQGREWEKQRAWADALKRYQNCLASDPNYLPALTAMANRLPSAEYRRRLLMLPGHYLLIPTMQLPILFMGWWMLSLKGHRRHRWIFNSLGIAWIQGGIVCWNGGMIPAAKPAKPGQEYAMKQPLPTPCRCQHSNCLPLLPGFRLIRWQPTKPLRS